MTRQADLTDQIAALETSLGGTAGVVTSFGAELGKLQGNLAHTEKEVAALAHGLSTGLRQALAGAVLDGTKLSDTLRDVAKNMADTVLNAALKPVTDRFAGVLAGGLLGQGFAKGGAFVQGHVMPFARGDVVAQPTAFAMRGGTGLMGEAGPEAIMPLTRGPDGSLGVRALGGAPVTVVMNITTPDVAGFARSQSQIAAQALRALARGQRNR